MDLLIKNMEMPKGFKPSKCRSCPLKTYVYTNTDAKIRCPFFAYLVDLNFENKACPLVEVPPHGRVINADKFIDLIKHEYSHDFICENDVELLLSLLKDEAPTVLEANR